MGASRFFVPVDVCRQSFAEVSGTKSKAPAPFGTGEAPPDDGGAPPVYAAAS